MQNGHAFPSKWNASAILFAAHAGQRFNGASESIRNCSHAFEAKVRGIVADTARAVLVIGVVGITLNATVIEIIRIAFVPGFDALRAVIADKKDRLRHTRY